MNILHITGGFPSDEKPHNQPFIKAQIDSLISKGINIEVLDLKGYNSPFNYINSRLEIRRIVSDKKINLIHAHYSYCGLSSILAGTKIPIVLSLMGSDLLGSANLNGRNTLRGYFDKNLTKIISRFADAVIVKSGRMKDILKTKKQVFVIPNGVNFEIFKPFDHLNCRDTLNLDPKIFYVLFLANPERHVKNFALAKKSIDVFKNKYSVNNIELLTVHGLAHDKIVQYLNAGNLLLFTSFREGSPNVVKEAMACNLPVISTDVGDVNEVISGTENCFIVPFDSENIADKINIIYRNNRRTNGREKINHLNDEIIAEKIIDIYKDLIDKKII